MISQSKYFQTTYNKTFLYIIPIIIYSRPKYQCPNFKGKKLAKILTPIVGYCNSYLLKEICSKTGAETLIRLYLALVMRKRQNYEEKKLLMTLLRLFFFSLSLSLSLLYFTVINSFIKMLRKVSTFPFIYCTPSI